MLALGNLWSRHNAGSDTTGEVEQQIKASVTASLLRARPRVSCFDQRVVARCSALRKHATNPSPNRQEKAKNGEPPPTVERTVKSALQDLASPTGLKRPLFFEGAVEHEHGLPIGPSCIAHGLGFTCDGCGQHDQWSTKAKYLSHLSNPGVCNVKNKPCQYLPSGARPLDDVVQLNLRRLQYQALHQKQGRPSKRSAMAPEPKMEECCFCDTSDQVCDSCPHLPTCLDPPPLATLR